MMLMLPFAVEVVAQSIQVTNISGAPVCAGSDITITFRTTNGSNSSRRYTNATIYTVYLSSALGVTPYTNIGTFSTNGVNYSTQNNGVTSGITQTITIPATTPSGILYRIALGSTSPNFNGSGGSGASNTFTINALPSFSVHPSTATQNYCLNGPATALTVTASAGSGFISGYQWYSNTIASNSGGTLISGATGSSYTPSTSASGTLYYYCVVRNSNNCTRTSNVSGAINVTGPPTITSHPSTTPQTVCLNGTTTALSVSATGSSLTYQWYSNTTATNSGGTLITGATSASYTPPATSAGTLYYYCVVSGSCSFSSTSNVSGAVTVNTVPPVPGSITGNSQVCGGSSGNLFSIAPVPGATSYTWSYSGTGATITNGNTTTASIAFTSTATSGTLSVTANNSCGASLASTLTVTTTAFVSQPANTSSTPGGAAVTFTVSVSGTVTGYQWQFSADGISGWANVSNGQPTGITYANSNTATLTATPGSAAAFGIYYYRCVVTTIGCSLTSDEATLSIGDINNLCANAIPLVIDGPAVQGTLINATFNAPFSLNDVWYKVTPSCTVQHTINVAGFSSNGGNVDWEVYNSTGCPVSGAYYDRSNSTNDPETKSTSLAAGTTYYIRVVAANTAANSSIFTIDVGSNGPSFILNNNGTPAAGNILVNASNVPLFGFTLTPDGCAAQYDFTGLTISATGTATASDLNNFQIIYDANNNGVKDATETSISGTGIGWSASMSFSVSGQTGLTGARRYLLIAKVALGATNNRTFTANLAGSNVTASVTVSGSAAGNQQTIKSPQVTITAIHPAAGTIDQNTSNNIIATFKLDAAYNTVIPTGLTVTTAGTYIPATDITRFSLYQNNANNAISPTLIATITTFGSAPATLVFTGTGDPISAGTSQYLFVTVDVPLSGTDLNTVSITATPLSNFSFSGASGENVVKTGTDPSTAGPVKTINGPRLTIAQVHPAAGNITQGTINNRIATYELSVSNLDVGFVDIQSITLTTGGTYTAGDITTFKLWQNDANTLVGATLVGTITASGNGTGHALTFNSGFQSIANAGYSYLMLTADVNSVATLGRTLLITSTNFTNINVLSSWGSKVAKLGTNPVPASNTKTIVGPIVAITTAHPLAGNMLRGSTDNLLAAFKLVISNADILPITAKFTTSSGSYVGSSDVIQFKLYQNDANSLTGATLVGTITATAGSSQVLNFTSGFYAFPAGTTGYLMLCTDLTGNATSNRTVSITSTALSNFTFSSSGPVVLTGSASLTASSNQNIVPKLDVYSTGTKSWNNTTANWGQNSGGAGGGYANSVWLTNGYAQLEGTAGQLSVTNPVIADKLISIINNYRIDASSTSNGITLTSPAIIDIRTGTSYAGNTSANPVLYGVNGFTKIGTGELELGSDLASTFSGTIFVTGGTLTLGKKAGGYQALNTLNNNPVEMNNARMLIAGSSGANGSVRNFTSLTTTGADTIGLYLTGSNVYYNVTPVTNASSFGSTNAVPLTISGSLKVDNGGSPNIRGAFANATNQNFIAFGDVTYTGNTTFEAYAKNANLKKRTGDIININLGGYGHYITGVEVASGTIRDNGFTTTFLGNGSTATDGGSICFNAAASEMTGDWIIGDPEGENAAWVVTNTTTCLTTGSVTINNYSKLNLQLSVPGNQTITYAPEVIHVYGLGPYSNSYTFGSALDFYDFARATDTVILPTDIVVHPAPNSNLAAIGVMIGDDSTSNSTGFFAAFQLNGTVTGTGGLEKTGPGILILNAQNGSGYYNTYADSTRIIRGTLIVNEGSNLGTGPVLMHQVTKNNTILKFYNTAQTIASLASAWSDNSGQYQMVQINGTTLTINQATNTTFGNGSGTSTGYIQGTGNIIKSGTGTLTLTGANTYTGLTQVKGGTLELKNSAGTTLPATNNVDVIGGKLLLSVNQTLNNVTLSQGNITLGANVTLTINGTFTLATDPGNITLGSNAKIVYGTNATLVYAGTALQETSINTNELPDTNGPKNIVFSNGSSSGVKWSDDITLTGTATVNGWVDMNGKTINGSASFILNGYFGGPLSANTTAGSATISNVNTNSIRVGMEVTGTGIPANTTVIYIDPLVTKTAMLSAPATTTGTYSLTFGYRGGLIVTLPGGIDAHVQVSNLKRYNSGANYIFNTPTAGTQIFPAFPTVGILSYSPAWNVTINAGVTNKVIMGSNSDLAIDHNLTLNSGIFTTGNNLITWNNTGGVLTGPANSIPYTAGASNLYNNSYIATTLADGSPLTLTLPFDGSKGFRIKNIGNSDTYFPVGADYISASRMMINNTSTTDDFTVVVGKGDLMNTPKPRVNRIWYVSAAGGADIRANMRLFFTKRSWSANAFPYVQDEIETGFLYSDPHLIQRDYDGAFLNSSLAPDDVPDFISYADNIEIFAQYTVNISPDASGATNGINTFSRFSVVNEGNIILPVHIVNVNAYRKNNTIQVDWTALNEMNMLKYEVEKSTDGIYFAAIDQRTALNNGNPANTYTTIDVKPFTGKNYYRIKAYDKNGTVSYSEIVSVNFEGGSPYVQFYPNPVKNHILNIKMNNLAPGRYNLVLYTASGQEIYRHTIALNGGASTENLVLPPYIKPGTYFAKLFNGNDKYASVLIVQ